MKKGYRRERSGQGGRENIRRRKKIQFEYLKSKISEKKTKKMNLMHSSSKHACRYCVCSASQEQAVVKETRER